MKDTWIEISLLGDAIEKRMSIRESRIEGIRENERRYMEKSPAQKSYLADILINNEWFETNHLYDDLAKTPRVDSEYSPLEGFEYTHPYAEQGAHTRSPLEGFEYTHPHASLQGDKVWAEGEEAR